MFYFEISFNLNLKNNVFIYIINVNVFMIQIRNVINKIIIISRYAKLNRILNYKKKIVIKFRQKTRI